MLFFKNKQQKTTVNEERDIKIKELSGEMTLAQKEEIYAKGMAKVLDLIAPSAMGVSSSYLQIGTVYARTIFVAVYPSVVSTGWLDRIIGIDIPLDVSMFINPVDTNKILKRLKKKATQVESQISIERQEGLTRDPVLEMAYKNVENLRDQLQAGVEKFFSFGLYINIFGKDEKELNKNTSTVESILNARSIYTKKAIFRTREGFISCLPLALDKLVNHSPLNTSPLSTIFPFVSADVSSGQGILYGINRHNNSLVLFDRFSMENANMVVFAKSGAGKSYAVKLEILRSLMLGTSAIIIDPENEYHNLSKTVGGSFINISLNSKQKINPFDLPYEEDRSVKEILRSNIADLLGLLKLMMGSITPEEEAILEQAIKETYNIRDISENTEAEDLRKRVVPIFSDFAEVLKNMQGAEDLSMRLQKYTQGIFSGFLNEPTNVSLDNQLVVFNIRDLEEELRPLAMYLVLHYIWNQIRSNIKKRLIVADEAWVMMGHEEAANFMFSIAKRIRKYYGGLTTITQDIADFMSSKQGKAIVSNSSIQLLMKQSQSSIDVIADTFYLTDQEKYLLMECGVGEGIFFAGNKRAAIQVVASYNENKIITTDPKEILERKEREARGEE